ncbi:hypothetical protein NQ314_015827 [Rhamnusium bicolor]|uniref:HTH psq-type domain-containing protein n=1 Tax=Rhamnusium bicolor TaxID=1586634 RepID=A0AAV8WYH0_9CUCU|nr:hypothetical protein NQ314_015827 [Rhamnusium bicolor]
MTLREALEVYGVPKSTLHRYLRQGRNLKSVRGQTQLLEREEENIKDVILCAARWGYPFDSGDIRYLVEGYLERLGQRSSKFVDNLLGEGNNQYISASEADTYSTKSQSVWQSSLSQSSSDCDTRSTSPLSRKTKSTIQTRRNMGGRKPVKDINCSPEEEERRRIRREQELEHKKQCLQDELQELQQMKEQLEYILESHKVSPHCRVHTQSPPDVKPFNNNIYDNRNDNERVKTELIEPLEPINDIFLLPSPTKKVMLSSTVPISKPSRPNYLNVGATAPMTKSMTESIAGVPISTPSTGMTFNFESLMGGGTGLTPVSAPLVPSCSTQQRNIPRYAERGVVMSHTRQMVKPLSGMRYEGNNNVLSRQHLDIADGMRHMQVNVRVWKQM